MSGRRRRLRLAMLAVAPLCGLLLAVRALSATAVRVVPVGRGDAVAAVYASGTVEAVDRVEVKARAIGTIGAIVVAEGQRVSSGELLARLEAPGLRIDVDRNRAEAQAARERSLPSVAALRAQATMYDEQLRAARAEQVQDERIAHAGGVATRQLEQSQLHLATLTQQLNMVRAQLRETEVLRHADVLRSASDFASAEVRSRDAEVRSPIDGDVLAVVTDVGRLVQPNEVLLRVGDTRHLRVEAIVDEEDRARVQLGAACAVRPSALGEHVLHGRVTHIAPEADRERHGVRIHVTLDDASDGLCPGMSAEVDVIVAHHEHALLVPRDAIRDGRVWRVEADGRVHRRAVRTGIGDLLQVEVLAGLAEGDRVVAAGDAELSDGMRVSAEP
jgi:multidrug efflux pump subunit AcrA (membrane-fusion protein)